jgi:hypothetical protein
VRAYGAYVIFHIGRHVWPDGLGRHSNPCSVDKHFDPLIPNSSRSGSAVLITTAGIAVGSIPPGIKVIVIAGMWRILCSNAQREEHECNHHRRDHENRDDKPIPPVAVFHASPSFGTFEKTPLILHESPWCFSFSEHRTIPMLRKKERAKLDPSEVRWSLVADAACQHLPGRNSNRSAGDIVNVATTKNPDDDGTFAAANYHCFLFLGGVTGKLRRGIAAHAL